MTIINMKDDPKYQKFLIKDYKFWKAYLHPDQSIIGKVYLWCNREDADDFVEMTVKEREEFFEAVKEIKQAINELFKPDLFNYAALQNVTSHLHVQILPRYKEERVFEARTFKDNHWGKAHQTDFDFNLEEDLLMTIKHTLQNKLVTK